MAINKVQYGNETLMDITDTTATPNTVLQNNIFYAANGTRSVGTLGDMTGATANADGAAGLVPAPEAGENEMFLRGDGTWADGGKPMVVLSYGNSTWNDFITAYNNHVIVYCRASSNSNPATGSQTRMAFMAYVNNATSPTEVEFQYYRSVSSHSNTQQGDQTYVYKLTSANKWTVTVRENYTKVVAGTGLSGNWNNGAITLNASTMHGATESQAGSAGMVPAPASGETDLYLKSDGTWDEPPTNDVDIQYNTTSKKITKTINGTTSDVVSVETLKADMDLSPLPSVTSSDNGKSLRVSNGAWAATQDIVRLANATSSDTDKTVAAADIVALESNIAKKIDKEYAEEEKCFETKAWNGLSGFCGTDIWTDGENTYYSEEYYQYVLDKTTSTWSVKTWNGLNDFYGGEIWTDGENIYYSDGEDNQYVLDKSTSTWSVKTWNGFSDFTGPDVWTDGENIYCSKDSDHQYILDKSTSTWNIKTWNGLNNLYNNLYGGEIWTDGENIYFSDIFNQYVLDKATSTWSVKTWEGLSDFFHEGIWTDGENIYYSFYSDQYVLDKATSTWSAKTWEGLSGFLGEGIWTDGENIYYSYEANHYVLDSKPKLLVGTNGSFTPITLQSFMIDAVASNAGAHNGIYRGKCLGTAVTSAQYSAISSGTFDDLYIGDYWTIGNHNWVICDFDYYIRCGSVDVDQHHLVMMPSEVMRIPDGTALYGASGTLTRLVGEGWGTRNWNATSEAPTTHTTAGGYKYSRMRTVIMKAANTIVIDAFGSEHVLPFTELYYSPAAATDSGLASGWAWFADDDQSSAMSKSICDLCNETMVYGQQVWGRGSAYTNVGFEIGLDKFQLAIFALNRNFANTRYDWWLRSVASATQAAYVSNYGTAGLFSSASALGVRPRFLLVG